MTQNDLKLLQTASRRQKRLRVWKEEFEQGQLPAGVQQNIMDRLTTFPYLFQRSQLQLLGALR